MAKPRVFVARILPEPAMVKIAESCEMKVWEDDLPPSRAALIEGIYNCDGVLTLLTDRMDAGIMDVSKCLAVISNYAVGFDNIDIPAANIRSIQVGNTPGVLTETTADLAFALLMAAARRIAEADRFTRAGEWKTWSPMLLCGQDIHHATLGIIGLGRIGQEVAKRARGFDMRVLYHDPGRNEEAEGRLGVEYAGLEELLAESDFVSVHTPLSDATRHMISSRELSLMKPTAVLVNTSRGPVVDQQALSEALRDRRIAGAGIDVFESEPVDVNDPILTLDNVVVAPHIGSASVATRTRMAMMAAENLIEGAHCRPIPYRANPEVESDFRCCVMDWSE